MGKRAPRQALGGHEHEGIREAAAEEHQHRRADLAQPERGDGLGGVVREPGGRRTGEGGEAHQAADDEARHERGTPHEPVLSHEPQHPEHASAEAVEHARREARAAGNRVVGGAQLFVPALEGLRYEREVRDLAEPVAGHAETQPEARIARCSVGALVDEQVIHAAIGTPLLRLVERAIAREIHAPRRGRAFGDRARRIGFECQTRGVGRHEGFGELQQEAVGTPIRTKADDALGDLARREQAHFPPVRRVRVAFEQLAERGLAAALELHVILRRVVVREPDRGARVGGRQCEARPERLRGIDGLVPRHAHVEMHERNREREELQREPRRDARERGIGRPEGRPAGPRRGDARVHAPQPITPRACKAARASPRRPRRSASTLAVCSPRSGGARS